MLVTRDDDAVKKEMSALGLEATDAMLTAAESNVDLRQLEQLAWGFAVAFGARLMATALAERCRAATEKDLEARDLDRDTASLRMDRDYHATLTTTFGPVTFPWFAYRDRSSGVATVTRTPARDAVLPHFQKLRSSELLVEWESRLGSDHPFRYAQQAMTFFTHGAVTVQDTTIAEHMVTAAGLVNRTWTYRSAEDIAELLQNRATRDSETDRPLLYASTDAHTLRTYVDETWDAQWKSANGIRLWCIDRFNGAVIHLGGEYTWGDCTRIEATFRWLRETGRLPAEGRFANGLNAQIVLITDGAPWIRERIWPVFPTAVAILDAYHLMEHLAEYAAVRFGKGSKRARKFYREARAAMYGTAAQPDSPRKAKKRTGHRKTRRPKDSSRPPLPMPDDDAPHARVRQRPPALDRLLALVNDNEPPRGAAEAYLALIGYLVDNAGRIDYERWRARGYQIGSGAMESLHRTASQTRLKVAGIRCLRETSQAIFNLRMLRLCGRWEEFWNRGDLTQRLVDVFCPHREIALDVQ